MFLSPWKLVTKPLQLWGKITQMGIGYEGCILLFHHCIWKRINVSAKLVKETKLPVGTKREVTRNTLISTTLVLPSRALQVLYFWYLRLPLWCCVRLLLHQKNCAACITAVACHGEYSSRRIYVLPFCVGFFLISLFSQVSCDKFNGCWLE